MTESKGPANQALVALLSAYSYGPREPTKRRGGRGGVDEGPPSLSGVGVVRDLFFVAVCAVLSCAILVAPTAREPQQSRLLAPA